ncbi:MAG TPA: chemotaxis protein CheW [Limnobacter sp.]|uniref:chemotaxis protein CheW n=1 Tax=Limnobacter sp. TaxID=2003368 RepID=UPI002ED8617D
MNDINHQIATAQEADSASHQYLTFQVRNQRLAVEILRIKEIIEYGRITVVPMMQQCISGVINLRGSVVPVVDLSARFGQGQTAVNRRTCIVILESQMGDETQVVGFMVDAVNAVVDISGESIAPPPQFGSGVRTDFLRGIGKVDEEFVLVLNVERLLDFEIPAELEASVAA